MSHFGYGGMESLKYLAIQDSYSLVVLDPASLGAR